jgi:hypothetical protein
MTDKAIELLRQQIKDATIYDDGMVAFHSDQPFEDKAFLLALLSAHDQNAAPQVWAGECPGCLGAAKHKPTCIDYFDKKTQGYPNRASQYDQSAAPVEMPEEPEFLNFADGSSAQRYHQYNQALRAYALSLREREGWIPVSEKLPDKDVVVLTCRSSEYDGRPIYAWGARVDDGEGWLWGLSNQRFGIDIGQDASGNDVDADDDYKVTHWMPLPAAPKE